MNAMKSCIRTCAILAAMCLTGSAGAQPLVTGPANDTKKIPGLEVLVKQAEKVAPIARTETGRAFIEAVKALPNQFRRYVWTDRVFSTAYTEAEYEQLPDTQKPRYRFRPLTELAYYTGVKERPLVDALALDDAVAGTDMETPDGLVGKRIMLFNPRVITQGRLLASLGADVTIAHNQQRMRAVYNEPNDVGEIPGAEGHPSGHLRLIYTDWPAEASTQPGGPYDLILISDWVSNGLNIITPPMARWQTAVRPLRPLGVDLDKALSAFAEALKPGGRLVIYAYGPIQPRNRGVYLPYADTRVPFSPEMIENAGLEALVLDADDTPAFLELSAETGLKEAKDTSGEVPPFHATYSIFVKPIEQ